jgi:hypothetical protein
MSRPGALRSGDVEWEGPEMTLQELGSLGEFIASIAVFVTLIFVAYELRQNTRTMRRANVREGREGNSRALNALLEASVAEIFIRGLRSLDDLDEVERYRFDNAFHQWVTSCEQVFLDHRAGMFEKDSMVAYENSIPGWLNTPGGSAWWDERQVWYTAAFREEVERLRRAPSAEAANAGPSRRRT